MSTPVRLIAIFLVLFALTVAPRLAEAQTMQVVPANERLQELLLETARALQLPRDGTAGDAVAAAQGDYERLIAVLYDRGFFGPEISITLAGREAADLSPLSPPARIWPIKIVVEPGPSFTFGRAKIGPLPDGANPPEAFSSGKLARTPTIRKAAQTGIDAWRDASHAKATIGSSIITAHHSTGQIDVDLRIAPGPALKFGRLLVPETSAVRPERISKIGGLQAGLPFSPQGLEKTRERLVATGAFQSVVLTEADIPNPDGTLDIALQLEDAKPRRIGFGAEVSSNEGLSFEAFWLHRNAFGGAERLRFDLDIDGIGGETGGTDYALGTTLNIPGFRRPDDTLTFRLGAKVLDEPVFQSDIFEVLVTREREFSDQLTAGFGGGLYYSHTDDVFGSRTFRHAVLDLFATIDHRDNQLDPRSGYFVGFNARPFLGLAGSKSGLRLTGDMRGYWAISDQTVLAGRVQLGSVIGPYRLETPPEMLFLSGGGGTVRGQDFQSLGVELPAGLSGGRSFAGVSAELRHGLTDTLGVVGFVDYGYVADASDLSDGSEHSGAGIGARYQTGLGAIRFDLATPLSRKATSDDVYLYIGLGEAF